MGQITVIGNKDFLVENIEYGEEIIIRKDSSDGPSLYVNKKKINSFIELLKQAKVAFGIK